MTPALFGTLYYISEWAVRLVMLVYVPQKRTPAATRTWLLLIFLLPWPGLIIYAAFGRIRVPQIRRDSNRFVPRLRPPGSRAKDQHT